MFLIDCSGNPVFSSPFFRVPFLLFCFTAYLFLVHPFPFPSPVFSGLDRIAAFKVALLRLVLKPPLSRLVLTALSLGPNRSLVTISITITLILTLTCALILTLSLAGV